MNKKHFIIPASIIFLVVSLVVFLIPVDVKNTSSFIVTYCVYLLFNIFSILIIQKNTKNTVKEEINGLSIYYIYGVFNLILILLWVLTKFIYINVNISIIILLIASLIYGLLLYFLINSKKFINQKENNNIAKIKVVKKWLSKIEIILNENKDNKDLNKLYEILRYMDHIPIEETQILDEKIENAIDNIVKNINKENIEKAIKLLNERNVILKNNK